MLGMQMRERFVWGVRACVRACVCACAGLLPQLTVTRIGKYFDSAWLKRAHEGGRRGKEAAEESSFSSNPR